jgi:oxygen-dependent protoporphyrinogen oxidase
VRALRDGLPRGIVVAGAAWDGVGLPAVVASARRAALDAAESVL